MTYTVHIPFRTWNKWQSAKDALKQKQSNTTFLPSAYPDCIIDASFNMGTTLHITFKSEAHYTWFILQQ